MKLINAAAGSLLLAIAPLAAHAEDMSYSYVEADYVDVDVDDGPSGDDTVFTVGGRYHFNDLFAIGAEFQTGNDVDFVFAGVRFSF